MDQCIDDDGFGFKQISSVFDCCLSRAWWEGVGSVCRVAHRHILETFTPKQFVYTSQILWTYAMSEYSCDQYILSKHSSHNLNLPVNSYVLYVYSDRPRVGEGSIDDAHSTLNIFYSATDFCPRKS